jgi:DNA polymerase-1
MNLSKPTLHLIDGHSLTFKAYYAIRNLTSPGGQPTGAVFGFLRMLLKFIDDTQPTHLAVVFDTGKPTFRSELYDAYKANREAPPPDFSQQMQWIGRLLAAMGLATFQKEGFEADDLIATMAGKAHADGGAAVILTADKDMFQLVNERVTMLRPGNSGDLRRYDPAAVVERLGVRPDQVIDWLALVGDASDNVPGVPGIGEKSATQLLQQAGSLGALLDNPEQVTKPKQRQSLIDNAERARLARQLVTIRRDVPFDWSLEQCRLPDDLWGPETLRLLVDLGFQSILKERKIQYDPAMTATGIQAVEELKTDYRTVDDAGELERWIKQAMSAKWVALDTETTSTDVMRAELVGISLSHRPGAAIYIPVGHEAGLAGRAQLPLEQVRSLLEPLLGGKGPKLSGHHSKYDWKILRLAGFGPTPPAFDTMIASYLLDPDKSSGHGLKTLGRELLGVEMRPISDLIGSGKSAITMAEVDIDAASAYACLDADATLRLTGRLEADLRAREGLRRLLEEVELPLIPVLMEMELGGFRLDVGTLQGLGEQVRARLTELSKQIWEAAGHPFNIGSPKQVAEVLYEELGLATGKKGKTGFSTAEGELERLSGEHPVPRLILEYRAAEKLQSTYIDALPKLVHPSTGRIHTSFNQTIAATGRLSSTEPNLQNIPIRTDMGRAIRRAFVADRDDHLLLKADYSQIELRILAHVSRDRALCEAYRDGRDIHRQTAGQVFHVGPDQVTGQMRAEAKTINFGIIYGMSPHGLAAQLGIGRGQAAEIIDRYFNTYPGVRQWIDRLIAEAARNGYVETLMGRRRLAPELNEKNRMVREAAQRVAVNTPIQGTCADMIKVAMIRIHARLQEAAPGGRMVCQVHDELVFSIPRPRIEAAGEMIRREMIEALPLEVPVEVDLSSAPNWAEC